MKNDSSKADMELSMAQGLTYRLGGRHGYVPAHTHTRLLTSTSVRLSKPQQSLRQTLSTYLDKLFLHWLVALG